MADKSCILLLKLLLAYKVLIMVAREVETEDMQGTLAVAHIIGTPLARPVALDYQDMGFEGLAECSEGQVVTPDVGEGHIGQVFFEGETLRTIIRSNKALKVLPV